MGVLWVNGAEVVRVTGRDWFGGYWPIDAQMYTAWGGFFGNPYVQLNANSGPHDPAAGGVFWVDDLETSTRFNSRVAP